MRIAFFLPVILLAACLSEKLALAPSPAVDFSGIWKLNEADSDDPRLLQNQAGPAKAKTSNDGSTGGGPAGGGGRGGKRSGRPSRGAGGADSPAPSAETLRLLGLNLRWPGKDLRINQEAGVVEIESENIHRMYRPVSAKMHAPASADRGVTRDHGRQPPLCGWFGKTLIVVAGDSDDDHPVELHYGISEDGRRLVEVVGVKGHMDGFTMSRVWDRIP
jgi:hypothetical protein